MAQCARGRGVGVEGCIPQRHVPGGTSGAICAWDQRKTSGGGGMQRPTPGRGQTAVDEMMGGSKEMACLLRGGGGGWQ